MRISDRVNTQTVGFSDSAGSATFNTKGYDRLIIQIAADMPSATSYSTTIDVRVLDGTDWTAAGDTSYILEAPGTDPNIRIIVLDVSAVKEVRVQITGSTSGAYTAFVSGMLVGTTDRVMTERGPLQADTADNDFVDIDTYNTDRLSVAYQTLSGTWNASDMDVTFEASIDGANFASVTSQLPGLSAENGSAINMDVTAYNVVRVRATSETATSCVVLLRAYGEGASAYHLT